MFAARRGWSRCTAAIIGRPSSSSTLPEFLRDAARYAEVIYALAILVIIVAFPRGNRRASGTLWEGWWRRARGRVTSTVRFGGRGSPSTRSRSTVGDGEVLGPDRAQRFRQSRPFINAMTGLVPATGKAHRRRPSGCVAGAGPGAIARVRGCCARSRPRRVHDRPEPVSKTSLLGLPGPPATQHRGGLAAGRRALMRTERGLRLGPRALEGPGSSSASPTWLRPPPGRLSYGERPPAGNWPAFYGRPARKRCCSTSRPAGLNHVETTQPWSSSCTKWRGTRVARRCWWSNTRSTFWRRLCHRMVVLELGRVIATGEPRCRLGRSPRSPTPTLGVVAENPAALAVQNGFSQRRPRPGPREGGRQCLKMAAGYG